MTLKNRYVFGCYPTVDEVIDIIRQLKDEGYTNEEICLVTRENYVPIYAERTDVKILTEEEVLAHSPKDPQEEAMWQKIEEAFAVVKRPKPRHLEMDYSTDDDPLYAYQDNLDKGCIVIMVDREKRTEEQEEKRPAPEAGKREEAKGEEVNMDAFLNATDAMRSNVITSTSKESVMDSGLVPDDPAEGYLHDNSSHTEGV